MRMRRPSTLQIGAVVLAVGLTGSYVWFRAAQAQQVNDGVMAGSKFSRVRVEKPSVATTTPAPESSGLLLPGSKAMILTDPAQRVGVAQASAPSTAPATTKRAVFYGSKSAPVDLTPTLQITGNSEPPAIFGNVTPTTAPTTQPAR